MYDISFSKVEEPTKKASTLEMMWFFVSFARARNENKYNKSDVDSLLLQKQSVLSDNSITMSKVIGLQTELDKKASLISPVFLGTPIAPTAGISNNSTQIATTEFVNDQIDELINDVLEVLGLTSFSIIKARSFYRLILSN